MRLILYLLCVLLPYSCSTPVHPSQALIVRQVEVSYHLEDAVLTRNYTEEDDLQGILTILRKCYPIGDCAIPQYPAESAIEITVFCSHSNHTYEIRNNQFLRRDHGDWQRIAPSDCESLPLFFMTHLGDKTPKKAA